jgi:hypothetical protein
VTSSNQRSSSGARAAFTIEPDPRHARVYESRYATFRKLYPRIRDRMEELSADRETEVNITD